MTAIGLVLLFIGVVGVNVLGAPSRYTFNRYDYIFGSFMMVGVLLTVAGIATFLWRAMP